METLLRRRPLRPGVPKDISIKSHEVEKDPYVGFFPKLAAGIRNL